MQLYAAGTSGNGSGATAMLSAALQTDANGNFVVPGGYSCPSAASELYLVASGGSITATEGSNSGIQFFTAVGTCAQVAPSSQFTVNEVTTAAAAWSFAQFLAPGSQLGASASNAAGLANAVATFNILVNPGSGTSPGGGYPQSATPATPRIDLMADLLNTCAASTTQTPCGQLFSEATASGDTAPANTLDAVLSLVHHPDLNVQTLYLQAATSTAFGPAPATSPSDWTLFISFSGGGIFEPGALGITSTGDVWVSSYPGVASRFATTGQAITPSGINGSGMNSVYGLAIDAQDNVWIPNESSDSSVNGGLGSVTELNSQGQPVSGVTGYSAGGLDFPVAIAIDPNSTAWTIDYGNSHLTLLNASGQPVSGAAGYSNTSLIFPQAIAIDANHNAWLANEGGVTITKASPDGTQFSSYNCCNAPAGLAIDQTGNVWVANYYGDSVSEVAPDGSIVSPGYTSPSLNHPQGIAVDGSGKIWVANYRGTALTELAGSKDATPGEVLSPAAGWAPDAGLNEAYALAIDASGNVWVTNFGSNLLTKYIGLAAPVKTPMLGPVQAP